MDVEGANTSLLNISLLDYSGENVETFATEDLQLLKIMSGNNDMTSTAGSSLLEKFENISSTYFNRHTHYHLDVVKPMENKHTLKYPALLKKDLVYAKYGPIGICGLIQQVNFIK